MYTRVSGTSYVTSYKEEFCLNHNQECPWRGLGLDCGHYGVFSVFNEPGHEVSKTLEVFRSAEIAAAKHERAVFELRKRVNAVHPLGFTEDIMRMRSDNERTQEMPNPFKRKRLDRIDDNV